MIYLLFNQDGDRPSGVATYARHLARRISDCYCLDLNMRGETSEELRFIRVLESSSHDPDRVVSAILAKLPLAEIDSVALLPNVGDTCYDVACRLQRRLLTDFGIPARIIGAAHSDDENQFRVLERYAGQLSAVFGVTAGIQATLRSRLQDFPGPVALLHYPCPIDVAVQTDFSSTESEPLKLLFLGRLERLQKRVDRLPELIDALVSLGVPFRFAVAGDGRERAALEAAISGISLPESSHVGFVGAPSRSQVVELLSRSEVVVLVSEFEGMPLALLEAMSQGCCPVAMETEDGLGGLIIDGENGLLVPQGDIARFAETIRFLHLDRPLLSRLRASARFTVARQHTLEAHWRELQALCGTGVPPKSLAAGEELAGYYDSELRGIVERVRGDACSRVCVFGGGMFGRKLIDALMNEGVEVECIVDSDMRNRGKLYRGVRYEDPSSEEWLSTPVIAIGSASFAVEIREQIERCRAESDCCSTTRVIGIDSL